MQGRSRLAITVAFVVLLGLTGPVDAQVTDSGVSPAAAGLPPVIPIFPLPDAALFPNATHPFHIFEARYRTMIGDALKGNRIIGMVMLQPGFESDYEGRPPIFPVGCAGLITAYEALPDGRYNIMLGGLVKFRVTAEIDGRPYRLAQVTPIPETLSAQEASALRQERERLEQLLNALYEQLGAEQPLPGVPDEQVVDELAQALPMPRLDRLRLLEQESPLARARTLSSLLERMLAAVSSPR